MDFMEYFIVIVLAYNMGTWALTQTGRAHLDSLHHTHLKQLLGIRWPHCVSYNIIVLYQCCQCELLSIEIIKAGWRLFGMP